MRSDSTTPDAVGAPSAARRRLILLASLVTNLGLLGFFKYANFGLETIEGVITLSGLDVTLPRLDIVLPMGISFYTFQSMSYTIDVYRGVLAPLRGFGPFLLYISFFPQLVAGPIVRATEFLPQMPRVRRLHLPVLAEGLYMVVVGAFLKMVCADNLGKYVDAHWASGYTHEASAGTVIVLTLMFSGQIFCDFAGYSSIARGLALTLGLSAADELQRAVHRDVVQELLGALAYHAVELAARLPVRAARRQPHLEGADLHQPDAGDAARRTLARRRVHLHRLGRAPRRGIGRRAPAGVASVEATARAWLVRAGWCVVVQAVVLVTWVVFRSAHMAGAWQFLANVVPLDLHGVQPRLLWGLVFLVPVVVHHAWHHAEEQAWVPPLGPVRRASSRRCWCWGSRWATAGPATSSTSSSEPWP